MRRAKRWAAAKSVQRPLACGRCDDRDGHRRRVIEWRQQARDRPSQQSLAGSGRTDEQQAVLARQGDLQTSSRLGLATDLAQVGRGAIRPGPAPSVARLVRRATQTDPERWHTGRSSAWALAPD